MNVYGLPFGKTFSREWLIDYLYQTTFAIPDNLAGLALRKARSERKKKAEDIIDKWVRTGALTRVPGGYSRGQQVEMVGFVFDGGYHRVERWRYFDYLAELKEQRAQRSPEEQRRRNTERKVAELEAQLKELKDGAL